MTPTFQSTGNRAVMLFLLVIALILPAAAGAQELNGVKIQVNPDALTILKFNGEVRNFEFGRADMFTAQVQDDKKLRIKTLTNNPSPTNLTVTEGNRTHIFIIEVVRKIDINTFKGYYDYSDLKALRRLAAAGSTAAVPAATASDVMDKAPAQQEAKPAGADAKLSKAEQKAQKAKAKADAAAAQKAQDEEAAREALADQEARDQKNRDDAALKSKQQAREEARQKAAAAEAEKKRLKDEQLARAQAEKEEKARERELERQNEAAIAAAKKRDQDAEKKRKADEQAAQALQARRDREIAAAQEKDRKALMAQAAAEKAAEDKKQRAAEADRQAQKKREEAEAWQRQQDIETAKKAQADAAKKRAAEEAAARKKEAALEAERKHQEEIAQQRQAELEQEQKQQAAKRAEERKAREAKEAGQRKQREEQAQKRADALIKNPYWRTEWHKRYPQINFAELPQGQMITGEYYLPKDTLANNAAAIKTVDMPAMLDRKSEAADGVQLVLEGISLSGVNCFMRVRVVNGSGKDFLVGRMMLSWWKDEGGSYYLTPCYITDFPVVYPGSEATIVYGCRGVNASDKDNFQFSMKERTGDRELTIAFTGKLYNKELNR